MIDVALLGTGGMMPLPDRFLTSLMCRLNGKYVIIDCGEGTQVSIKMLGWGFKNIDVICFTHFHADHIAGLPGLLLTIGNSGRTKELNIIGPKGVEYITTSLCVIAKELPYNINFIEIEENQNSETVIGDFIIKTTTLDHKLHCLAYSININRKGKFLVERAKKLNIPKEAWTSLQNYKDIEIDGRLYKSSMVMGAKRKGIKICYCTDTRPVENIALFVKNANLFVCEGLYGDDSKLKKAIEYKHMIFSEAATIAKEGMVEELWLTHFSPSLVEPQEFSYVATEIFKNSIIGQDRMTKTIFFED